MSTLSASKKTSQTIRIRPACPFCLSSRWRFYQCGDDRGIAVSVRCDRCGAQSPESRGPIGDDDRVTVEMKREAAAAWSEIWGQMVGPPAEILVDVNGKEITRPARKPRGQRAPEPTSPAPARFFMCTCPSEKHGELTGCSGTGSSMTEGLCAWCVAECRKAEHAVLVIPPPKAMNGHHRSGSGF